MATGSERYGRLPYGWDRAAGKSSSVHDNAFEKIVCGVAAARAQAAAVRAVGGGTAGRVTTDRTGTGYDVVVSGSNNGSVVVHLDSSFAAFAFSGERELAMIDAVHGVRSSAARFNQAAGPARAVRREGGTE